jgi:hypothetical protein
VMEKATLTPKPEKILERRLGLFEVKTL